jgi:hypothetical protein
MGQLFEEMDDGAPIPRQHDHKPKGHGTAGMVQT